MEIKNLTELVENARAGDKKSLDRLAVLAQESVRRYVFRITLDDSLTQDIVQEVMLEMVRVLDKLRRADRFFAWLHGIAFNLLRRHYGDRWREKTATGATVEADLASTAAGEQGLANLVNAELKQIIYSAMGSIEPRHRAVLTMRCYENMSYKEIAERMGLRELSARALFFRAKNALAKQLSRRGLGRGSLLTALVLFGKMTALSEAAAGQVAVTAAALKVGLAGSIIGAAATETVVVTVLAAAVITAATVVAVKQEDNTPAASGEIRLAASPGSARTSAEVRETWYYYPEGVNGPVITRSVLLAPNGKQDYCQWLHNNTGNFIYDPQKNVITLTNHRMWESDYSVRRLPTDSPEMSDFIAQIQGGSPLMEYIGSRGRGLLIVATSGGDAAGNSWTTRHCNALDEDYFKCDWPRNTRLIDARDAMHRRGWTYFAVEGHLRGEPVSGTGCMPFVYEAGRTRKPWLSMRVGDRQIDGDAGRLIFRDAGGKTIESGSAATWGIFAGLGRPWAGLHTIDTVRRDAALKRIPFDTRVHGDKAEVVLHCGDIRMDYVIDMHNDLVEQISFVAIDGTKAGELIFSYDKPIDTITSPPRLGSTSQGPQNTEGDGIKWLVRLATLREGSD